MKRFLITALAVLLFMLPSCSWNLEDDVTDKVTQDISNIPSDGAFLNEIERGIDYSPSSYRVQASDFDIGDGVFHYKVGRLHILYNPKTNYAHYMCFIPGCTHKFQTCLGNWLRASSNFIYCDGDLYCLYLHPILEQDTESGLARISPDGSTMEMLYRMDPSGTYGMYAAPGYIYINKRNEGLMRYDISTGKMEIIGEFLSGLIVTEHGLIVHSSKSKKLLLTDLDMKNPKELMIDRTKVLYSDNRLYYCKLEKDETGNPLSIEFYEYNLATDTDRSIGRVAGSSWDLLCVAEGYLYYLPNSPEAKSRITIYRVDIETGEVKTAMEDSKVQLQEMYYVNGKYYAYCKINASLAPWISPGRLYGSSIGGELVDRNNDGLFEFEPFVFDATDFP
ncbi:MAG: hypothetical protein IJN63_01260 [Clostridia bacterium]|nr:hypothetical protein [Clostridia bacterium]